MEIARLEVSTQQHLERMQETAKVNYIQYGKSTKGKKGKKSHSLVQGQAARGHGVLNPVEKVRSFHSHQTLATDVGKADTKKYRTAKLWMQHAEDVERKDTLRRFVSRGNAPHTL